ncbi:tRNA (adenine(58)-N(1))-methyltransferase catalytic subunit trmt61a [Desmophyllum pertusum]|uniref:tRNA (Adenine(58)-N(1))-methyltransferase catalytic subunit trmt61a n=1 Tax=Desmophyllum pertusum TaxID=174260 RepID=A0A9W9YKR5_9CNID|nr:tRNA (adenine(58)-N(1))-methyltransferase catalytic subunit trmt61a [Desmophyllum pertusum]
MSFAEYKERISKDDTVIIFLGHNSMQTVTVTPGKVHQTKIWSTTTLRHDGRKFGTKMYSMNRKRLGISPSPNPRVVDS